MRPPIALFVASTLTLIGCSPISPRGTSNDDLAAPLPAADNADLFAYRPDARQLEIGDELPDFVLIDAAGESFRISELRGQVIVMTFFADSDDPEGGAEALSRLNDVADELGARLTDHVVLMSVLIDDSALSADRLSKALASAPQKGPRRLFARADPESTALLSTALGVVIWKDADGNVGHTLNTVVIDPRGRFFDRFPGLDAWSPVDVVASASIAADR